MTFEGQQLQGAPKISEKLTVSIFRFLTPNRFTRFSNEKFLLFSFFLRNGQSLTFQKINRIITAIDSQPTFDGGVLINVLGRLKVSKRIDYHFTLGDKVALFTW